MALIYAFAVQLYCNGAMGEVRAVEFLETPSQISSIFQARS